MWLISLCIISSGACIDQIKYNYEFQYECEIAKTVIRSKQKPETIGKIRVTCREVQTVKLDSQQ